jgi:uncharacterized protein YecE (DUF72 family)
MIYLGTSGFLYWDWRGRFYPQNSRPSDWLKFYAEKFNALEINSSFYRLPSLTTVKNYKKLVPNLAFVFKLFKGITHQKELSDENVIPFLKVRDILGENLKCIIAQFPKTFRPSLKNLEFVLKIKERFEKEGINVSFELREPSWERFFEEMKKEKVVVCCISAPEKKGWLKSCLHSERLAYFRFHGEKELYKGNYSEETLKAFANKIRNCNSEEIFCFFNNTSKSCAPYDALKLKTLLNS